MNPAPTVGRIIHVSLKDAQGNAIVRPGIIVRTWGEPGHTHSYVNAQVFTDGTNDGIEPILWKTSLQFDETGKVENSWSWPPRS